jgi:hypothetical protein
MQHLRKLQPLFWTALFSLAAAAPATVPDNASPPKTGEIALHLTQRSPLSSRKEIARRLSCKESDLSGGDYDLTTYTFRAYIPPDYDPSTPYGVFVYLGNHDVSSVATKWEPLFDKSHMIFITVDWHSPMLEWQLVGLGFDAIDNLKRLYNIDTHRLYDMWFGSGSVDMPLAGADVYTGMIVCEDWGYFRRIVAPGHRFHNADFPPPPLDLLRKAKPHGIVLITLSSNTESGAPVISTALKEDGFDYVLSIVQTDAEMHYPNFAAGWITDPVLPFLDKAAQNSPGTPTDSKNLTPAPSKPADITAAASPTTPPSPASPLATSEAQHLLPMAKLYINDGNTELARTKLQTILASYPNDPAAVPAKKLLNSLPPPQ